MNLLSSKIWSLNTLSHCYLAKQPSLSASYLQEHVSEGAWSTFLGPWLKCLRARFAHDCLSTSLLQILDTPLLCARASAGCLWVLCGRLAPACACGSKYAGDGNKFLSVVELPEGAIVELELGIAKKANEYVKKILKEA